MPRKKPTFGNFVQAMVKKANKPPPKPKKPKKKACANCIGKPIKAVKVKGGVGKPIKAVKVKGGVGKPKAKPKANGSKSIKSKKGKK